MCWHEWSKWEQYLCEGHIQKTWGSAEMIPCTQRRQKRKCLKCGKVEDEEY